MKAPAITIARKSGGKTGLRGVALNEQGYWLRLVAVDVPAV
jgi:hypothetical protein